jgi:hypothetical protein
MLDRLTHDDFAGRVGERFTLSAPTGDTLELTLAEATASPEHAQAGRRTPFSLIFHGALSPYAPQGTWRVEHEEIGALDVFLVPIGPEGDAMRYEAVFT